MTTSNKLFSKRILILMSLAAITLILLYNSFAASQAKATGWSKAQILGEFPGAGDIQTAVDWARPQPLEILAQVSVAVRPLDGTAFAVAGNVNTGLFYYSADRNGQVSRLNLVFLDNSNSSTNYQIAFDRNNALHLVYAKSNPRRTMMYCKINYPQGPQEWADACGKGGRDLGSEVFGGSNGTFTQNSLGMPPLQGTPDVLYIATSSGGIMNILESSGRGNPGSWSKTASFPCIQSPIIRVAGNGDAFLVCRDEVGGANFSWARKPVGGGWGPLQRLGTCTNGSFNCSFGMTVTRDGKAAAFWGRYDISGAVWNGNGFTFIPPGFLGPNSGQYNDLRNISMFANPDNSMSAVWSVAGTSRAYFSSSRDGREWDRAEVIWDIPTNSAMEVDGGSGGGRIHIFGRFGNRDADSWRLWYSSGPGGGSEQEPPPVSTPNPTATPEPPKIPSPTPPVTPPPLPPGAPTIPNNNGWIDAETRQWVVPPFAAYWLDNGGLINFGRPITGLKGDFINGKLVQYFERARFEIGLNGQGLITRGLLGSELVQAAGGFVPADPVTPGAPTVPNPAGWQDNLTGQWVVPPFAAYWLNNGGLANFGRPITGVQGDFVNGKLVQYFERARFEIALNGEGAISRGLLGVELLQLLRDRGQWQD